ncbi:hypothetical protein BD413DRAFT_244920 [Trametes elegans]|nr:hypothetical protein BD413DRAFT_244920 [Trametes elegans]
MVVMGVWGGVRGVLLVVSVGTNAIRQLMMDVWGDVRGAGEVIYRRWGLRHNLREPSARVTMGTSRSGTFEAPARGPSVPVRSSPYSSPCSARGRRIRCRPPTLSSLSVAVASESTRWSLCVQPPFACKDEQLRW